MICKEMHGLNANQIKFIAITAMAIDHIASVFFSGSPMTWYAFGMHIIGRLTAPIMWFFIAEGFYYTSDKKRYLGRLFFFAVISHFAYCFAFRRPLLPLSSGYTNQTSVMWPLALSAVLIFVVQSEKIRMPVKILTGSLVCLAAFPADWSFIAVMCPLFLFLHRNRFRRQAADIIIWSVICALGYFLFIDRTYGIIQLFTFLTIPVLYRYNGERGKWKGMKWFFYIFYPAHLFLLGLIKVL